MSRKYTVEDDRSTILPLCSMHNAVCKVKPLDDFPEKK